MKKVLGKAVFGVLSILLITFIEYKYGLSYTGICGSGIHGLKTVGLYYLKIALIIYIIYLFYTNRKRRKICIACKEQIQDGWELCPYCGEEIKGDDKV